MTETEPLMTDINSTNAETLTRLPGVGLVMAERIIAARPFATVDDMQRVSGVGPTSLERLRSLVMVSELAETGEEDAASLEAGPQPEVEETIHPEEKPQPDLQAVPTEAVIRPEKVAISDEKLTPMTEAAQVTRAQALWMTLGAGVLSFVLAVALSLSILTAINGGLEFAAPARVAEISSQLDGLNRQAGVLEQDLDGVRTRLDNLERLSGRLDAVEETSGQLQAGVEQVGTEVDALGIQVDDFYHRVEGLDQDVDGLGQDVDDLAAQLEILQEKNSRFQGFLDGLRNLLGDLFESEET